MTTAFWHDRRVFVTGHTGFKGAWLGAVLARLGAEVHGFALEPLPESIYDVAGVARCFSTSVIADIRNFAGLEAALDAAAPEIVFHLAAQPLVRLSYEIPVETFAVNVLGTCHILEAVRRRPTVRAAVMVTSDKCYENREWVWGYREDEAMGGYDPYSASKGCSELVTSAYRRSFFEGGARIASGRAGNVIGGGDVAADRIVPDLVRSFRAGRTAAIRNPAAVRPWQHVLEPLSGYMALAEALTADDGARFADGWNFGPDPAAERSVRAVAETACAAWGPGAAWRHEGGAHPHEAGYLTLDSSKARRRLGWSPRWDFETAVAMTMAWYRAQDRDADMAAVTAEQIDTYFATTRPQVRCA